MISVDTNIKKKLVFIGLPIDKSISRDLYRSIISEFKSILPSEDEVFNGNEKYSFIIVPVNEKHNLSVMSVSDIEDTSIIKIMEEYDKLLEDNKDKQVGTKIPTVSFLTTY